MVKYLILDSDGTVFDSMPKYTEIFSETLLPISIPKDVSARLYKRNAGIALKDQYTQVLRKYGKDIAVADQLVKEFWEKAIQENLNFSLFSDVKPALEKLHQKYTIIISTNTLIDLLIERLNHTTIQSYIDLPLGKDERFERKEEHLPYIQKFYNLDDDSLQKEVVFVADGPPDIQFANTYGIKGIGRIGTVSSRKLKNAGAHATIRDFFELENILARI